MGTSKSKTSLSRKLFVGCRMGGAKCKETGCTALLELISILQLTVDFFICKF